MSELNVDLLLFSADYSSEGAEKLIPYPNENGNWDGCLLLHSRFDVLGKDLLSTMLGLIRLLYKQI